MKFAFHIQGFRLLLLLVIIISSYSVQAQTILQTGINGIITSIKNTTERLPVEKLHLHLDKPWYSMGDTLWFKAYLLEASYLNASSISGLLYIELINDSNYVVKRMMLPVNTGMSWGNIALDDKYVFQGTYTLRGYTNWMRNFGEDYLFKKSFYIVNPMQAHWLVNMQV